MTNPPDPDTSNLPPAPAPSKPARSGGNFFARFFAAILVILITTIITLSATAAGLLWVGFNLGTPGQLAAAQARVATLEAGNAALAARADMLATDVAEVSRRANDNRETLSDVQAAVDDMSELRGQIRDQLDSAVSQNATLVADARASRDQVAAFATAEADRVALLQELDRRSQRIERFLQRLSDIAGDAALDLGNSSPTPETMTTSAPTPTTSPTDTVTATAAAETATATTTTTQEPTPTTRGGIIGTATPTP